MTTPTAPIKPPEAPVKAPSKIPGFLVDLLVKYAVDAAPAMGAAVTRGVSNRLEAADQPPLSPVEQANVLGLVVMTVTRGTAILKTKLS